jgi:ADP-heptose:LPS heptosyltransferase
MGDTVLLAASLEELRRNFPHTEIHAVVNAAWAPLLENHPAIDRLIPCEWKNEKTARTRAVARLSLQLRKESYDVCLNFHASPSSSALAFGTGAKMRAIHRHGSQQGSRFGTVPVPGQGSHKAVLDRDLDTLRAIGLHVAPGILPKLHLTATEKELGRQALARIAPGAVGPMLGLGLGASRPSKSWPIDRYAVLAVDWAKSRGPEAGCIAFVSEAETELKNHFLKKVSDELESRPELSTDDRIALRKRIGAAHQLSVRGLAQALSACHAFVANDAGPRHIAAAVGTPTATFFGPEDPFDWHPYPEHRHIKMYIDKLACRPPQGEGRPPWCGVEVCVEQKHRCLTDIGVKTVLEKLTSLEGMRES